jgi:putative ABC transport system permease protein
VFFVEVSLRTFPWKSQLPPAMPTSSGCLAARMPDEADLHLNLPSLLFTRVATTLAGLLFGTAPAWYASCVDPGEALKESNCTGVGAGCHRLRQTLVLGEFALALTLLAGAGLAIHSFLNLLRVDLGLRTDHVLTFYLPVPDSRPKDPEKIIAYYKQILSSVNAIPGVTSASAMTGLPPFGAGFGMPFTIVGKPAFNNPSMRPNTGFGMVTRDFFKTFGVRIVNRRSFTDQDTASSVKVAVVNEDFVKKYFKDVDPLQQRVSVEQLIPASPSQGRESSGKSSASITTSTAAASATTPEMEIPFRQILGPAQALASAPSTTPPPLSKVSSQPSTPSTPR